MDEVVLIKFLEDKIKGVQQESCEAHYNAGNADGRFQAYRELLDVLKSGTIRDLPKDVSDKIMVFCREGRKIQAIKEYRSATGLGLKESKDFIDKLCADIESGKYGSGKAKLEEIDVEPVPVEAELDPPF